MSTVYSEQLASGHGLVAGGLEVPDNVVWVVRLITVFYPSPSGGLFQLVRDSDSATLWWDSAGPTLVGQFRFWNQLNLVLPNTSTYTVSASGAPDFSLSGYALSLP